MNMLHYIIIWYCACSFISVAILHSGTWIYTEKAAKPQLVDRGVLLVQLLATILVIVAPFITEGNDLSIINTIVNNNMMSFASSTFLLLLIGITSAMAVQSRKEGDNLMHIIYWVISVAAFITYLVVIIILIPINVPSCGCKDGFFGTDCQLTCLVDDSICSGHGTCSSIGCSCDNRFRGELCNNCVNQFNYETNCTACNTGYSLNLECTTCQAGRDPSTDCIDCIDGYLDDPNYNSADIGCLVCKENYYRPTSNPLVGSYNKFLEFGDVCTACEGYPNVCSGHGTCAHFLSENEAGGFQYENKTVLGQLADGECTCDVGYAGPNCIRAHGFDLDNPESICNGHGDILEVYDQIGNNIFETFQYLECQCDDGYVPSTGDDACSCLGTSTTTCQACIFGYYLENNECKACPGGGFLKACNADIGAGVCNAGTCTCLQSYIRGAYKGDSCAECMNNNFYKIKNSVYADQEAEPERCQACPGATGPEPNDACGGHGFCVTDTYLTFWDQGGESSDSLNLFLGLTGFTGTRTDLDQLVGTCVCHEGYSLNMFGLCS